MFHESVAIYHGLPSDSTCASQLDLIFIRELVGCVCKCASVYNIHLPQCERHNNTLGDKDTNTSKTFICIKCYTFFRTRST